MKQCKKCQKEIDDKYEVCAACFSPPIKPGMWSDDATVDQLMKINANMGMIVKELQNIRNELWAYSSKK